jgi:hypothetical protein
MRWRSALIAAACGLTIWAIGFVLVYVGTHTVLWLIGAE